MVVELGSPTVTGGTVVINSIRVILLECFLFGNIDQAACFGICLFGDVAVALGTANTHFRPMGFIGISF